MTIFKAKELSEAISAVLPAMDVGGLDPEYKNIFFNRKHIVRSRDSGGVECWFGCCCYKVKKQKKRDRS